MQYYNIPLYFNALRRGGDQYMAMSDYEIYQYIKWQTECNPDYTFMPPVHKDMNEEDIHKIVGAYIVFTVIMWAALIGVALIAGLVMWLFMGGNTLASYQHHSTK